MSESFPHEHAARLRALDTCAVSDALDAIGLTGSVTGLASVAASGRIAGTVVTVRLGPAAAGPSARHLCTAAIEHAGPGQVIVVEHRARSDAAGWGGLLSLAASLRGVTGTIVDGAVRDVDESRALGYPVFARAVLPRTARGRVAELAWNAPIRVGDVTVEPGDFVVADGSGVVFVPAARMSEVLGSAEAIAAREAAMAAAVRAGTPISQVLGGEYESLLEPGAEGDRRP